MFKRGSIVMTIWNLIVAAGLIALGIATIANNANEDFRNVMFMIAGIFIIVDASLRLLTQVIQVVRFDKGVLLKTSVASAATGASELAVGILLILISQEAANMGIVLRYLVYFLSILLITLGTVSVIYAIVFLVKKAASVAANIVSIILGAILITGGILILVYVSNEHFLQFIFVMTGIFFTLAGVGLIFVAIAFALAAHRQGKVEGAAKEENAAIEAVEEAPAEEAPAAEEPVADQPAEEEPKEEAPEAEEKPEEKPEDKPE